MNYLAPSILSADFKILSEELSKIEKGGAKYVHIDVMDGAFVPSISFGMPVIKSIRGATDMVFDVHLMIEEPDRYISDFAQSGADIITVHAEAAKHLDRTIQHIHECGCKAGVALNPATDLSVLEYILQDIEMVLIMSVNPGFGGQKYIPYSTKKISALKKMIDEKGLDVDIEVDGGIKISNVKEVLDAGANVIVAGSAIFSSDAHEASKEFMDILSGNTN